MATIKYNGMELEEFTSDKPVFFDTNKEGIVWNDISNKDRVIVLSYDPRSKYPIRSNNDRIWKHFAFIPEKPEPRRATNRELTKWLAQGNGERIDKNGKFIFTDFGYKECYSDDVVDDIFLIRKWDDTEWHEPTVDYMGIEEA